MEKTKKRYYETLTSKRERLGRMLQAADQIIALILNSRIKEGKEKIQIIVEFNYDDYRDIERDDYLNAFESNGVHGPNYREGNKVEARGCACIKEGDFTITTEDKELNEKIRCIKGEMEMANRRENREE